MKYRAIILDLDGTTIPNREDGMPSPRVIQSIRRAHELAYVCVATGRGINGCREIIKQLGLTKPCIVNGGTRIVDPVTEEVLWEKGLDKSQVESVMQVLGAYWCPVFFGDEFEPTLARQKVVNSGERVIYVQPIDKKDVDPMLGKLDEIPNIVAHKMVSWTPDHFDIHITHAEATKRHALEIVLEMLGVHKSEVIAIGDGNNDLPLFELAGYRVAMGNASEELKSKADLVAPSVDDDGVAVAIDKLLY